MSNIDMDARDREERSTALDTYANGAAPAAREAIIPQQGWNISGDRIVGAQEVAVYRNTAKVLADLKALAAAAGEAWYYRYPVKDKGKTVFIEGPSIKLANDLARIYGNCDVDVRVVDAGDSWVFYARFTDFETGFSLTRPLQQRKNASRLGGSDDGRRQDIAFQIGVSKAERNVVVNALQTYTDYAFEEARGAMVDKIGKNLARYIDKTKTRLEEIGGAALVKRVEVARGRPFEKWLAPDVARTIAEIQAINDGMAAADETWPLSAPSAPSASPPSPSATAGQTEDDPGGNRRPADGAGGNAAELSATAGPASDHQPEPKGGDAGERRRDGPEVSSDVAAPAPVDGPGPATPRPLTADERKRLRVLVDALASVNTPAAVEKGASRFWDDNGLGDDDVSPLAVAAVAIVEAQAKRTRGQISVADANAITRKVLPL